MKQGSCFDSALRPGSAPRDFGPAVQAESKPRRWWIFFPLLVPLLGLCALLPGGCSSGGSSSATPAPTKGNLTVAFLGSPPSQFPGFRNVLLNISGVRVNKSINAGTGAPGWSTIPVPTTGGIGNPPPGDLQIDLLQIQTGAMLFNTSGVPVGTYNTVQVVVDPTNPGTIVPACQAVNANQEGCINYPMAFVGSNQAIVLDLPTPFNVAKNGTAPLLLQLTLDILETPPISDGTYQVSVTPTQANAGSFLGAVTGSVKKSGTASGLHLLPLAVNAEVSGTSVIVASANVRQNGTYTLNLPAFPTVGTTYDSVRVRRRIHLRYRAGNHPGSRGPGDPGFFGDGGVVRKSLRKSFGRLHRPCHFGSDPGAAGARNRGAQPAAHHVVL